MTGEEEKKGKGEEGRKPRESKEGRRDLGEEECKSSSMQRENAEGKEGICG